jgi:hypothetical protein
VRFLFVTLVVLAGIVPSSALAQAQSQATITATPAFPTNISANGRYLVDQNGVPFLLVGDSPQAMIGTLSEADAEYFFANRQAAGFNAQWINLLCTSYTGCRADGSTDNGVPPFTTQGDLSTPNEPYFSKVDHILQLAAKHGQVVLLDPIETGGWTGVAVANGPTKAFNYGKYLGQRYKGFPNIVWMSGNDFQNWGDPNADAAIRAVAQGIKETDPKHLQTVELNYQRSGSLDAGNWAPLVNLDAAYTYFPTYDQVLKEYNRSSVPVFMVEANYEGEHNAADQGTPQILRRQEYWTLLSGATGQLYGNRVSWQFLDGWKTGIDTPGSLQMKYVTNLFAPRQWYNLVPDQGHSLVTKGNGTYADGGSLGANDYLTAARTPDGTLAIAYMPTARTISVDLSKLSGPVNASWYDPARGVYLAISGSPLPNSGTHEFSPPGTNSDGDGDWVLVLETSQTPASAASVADVTTAPTVAPSPTPAPPSEAAPAAPSDAAATANGSSAAWRFVQVNNAAPQSLESSVSVTYPRAQTAGDTNILAIGWNDSSSSIVSVSDSAGNNYQVAAPTARGDGVSQALYYAPDVAGGANTVTVTFSGAVPYADIRITEYSGLDRTNPFGATASASGADAQASSGSVNTVAAGELVFGAGITTGMFSSGGTGFTTRSITTPDGDIVEDQVATAPGSYAATGPVNGNWLMQVATFH